MGVHIADLLVLVHSSILYPCFRARCGGVCLRSKRAPKVWSQSGPVSKANKRKMTWWHPSVTPVTREGEAGGSLGPRSWKPAWATGEILALQNNRRAGCGDPCL